MSKERYAYRGTSVEHFNHLVRHGNGTYGHLHDLGLPASFKWRTAIDHAFSSLEEYSERKKFSKYSFPDWGSFTPTLLQIDLTGLKYDVENAEEIKILSRIPLSQIYQFHSVLRKDYDAAYSFFEKNIHPIKMENAAKEMFYRKRLATINPLLSNMLGLKM